MTTHQTELYAKCARALRLGSHFCLACQHLIEPENQGEHNQQCPECGSRRITWLPPVLDYPPEQKP